MIPGNLLVSHRICHFRAIQPFDLECSGTFFTDTRYQDSLRTCLQMSANVHECSALMDAGQGISYIC